MWLWFGFQTLSLYCIMHNIFTDSDLGDRIPVQIVSQMVTVPILGTDLYPRDMNPNMSLMVEMGHYNCAVLFLSEMYWLFIYVSKYILWKISTVKPQWETSRKCQIRLMFLQGVRDKTLLPVLVALPWSHALMGGWCPPPPISTPPYTPHPARASSCALHTSHVTRRRSGSRRRRRRSAFWPSWRDVPQQPRCVMRARAPGKSTPHTRQAHDLPSFSMCTLWCFARLFWLEKRCRRKLAEFWDIPT